MHLSAERIIYYNKYILIYTDEDFLYLYLFILINPGMLHVIHLMYPTLVVLFEGWYCG